MLRSLQLNGFKSFADKTRFEFPGGVTVIVGPNGSGKSNIVDAVKWVLGAQSVKSLRGTEMADVIFHGTGAQRVVNTAEVSLTLSNQSKTLAIDADEVTIARRVYRSGEGEYFINGTACRLRDIRELLAGTGIATDAYSIIEQGKVDVMLQSSPQQRRALFEEAAGISRFKAKKTESERRLSRVEQNLLRLSDIVDEVATRLRRLRSQAGRARRYEELNRQLQNLRLRSARQELDALKQQQLAYTHERTQLESRYQKDKSQQRSLASQIEQLSEHLRQIEAVCRSAESSLAQERELLATLQATVAQHRLRDRDLASQIHQQRLQRASLLQHRRDVQRQLCRLNEQADQHEAACRTLSDRAAMLRRQSEDDQQHVVNLEREIQQQRSECDAAEQRQAEAERQQSVLRSQLSTAEAAAARCGRDVQSLQDECEQLTRQIEATHAQQRDVAQQVADRDRQLTTVREEIEAIRHEISQLQSELGELRVARAGASQRAELLRELQEQLEGVATGTRFVLRHMQRQDAPSSNNPIRGLVADRIRADLKMAPLVELALANLSHYVVIDSHRDLRPILDAVERQLPGRAGFVAADLGERAADRRDLSDLPGVIDRLDRLVDVDQSDRQLVERLLGRVYLVETLSHALHLAGEHTGIGLVTRHCEFVGADGTVVLGPKEEAAGVLSRQSELHALTQRINELDAEINQCSGRIDQLQQTSKSQSALADALSPEVSALTGKLSEHRLQGASLSDRRRQTASQRALRQDELNAALRQIETIRKEVQQTRKRLETAADAVKKASKGRDTKEQALALARQAKASSDHVLSDARVELATAQQEAKAARDQSSQAQARCSELDAEIASAQQQIFQNVAHRRDADRSCLADSSELATRHLARQALAQLVGDHSQQRSATQQQHAALTGRQRKIEQQMHEIESTSQQTTLRLSQLEHEQETLVKRYREEYELELLDDGGTCTDDDTGDVADAQQQIAELRRKINNLGAVNLEAVDELDELEHRHEHLESQWRDLSEAKQKLESIIGRINTDSRKMFLETLEIVGKHFQDLFERLFGGGQAEIVLQGDDSEDVLERGIEIVARPPGKQPRSISLLSGGEKTLTCVALLLAVFRSRPSPFCVLDEVDAALDEANIQRFAAVLREFLHATQFIVVTHSKRTMAFADTLYGITIQQTGISKPVSMRFENRATAENDDQMLADRPADDTQAA